MQAKTSHAILIGKFFFFASKNMSVFQVCNALALTARRLSFDVTHNSPFAVKARENGLSAAGGKPDDITLVLLLIA